METINFLEEPHKIFAPHLVNSTWIRPFQLYDKELEKLELMPEFQNANIYFIVKRKKLRFLPNKTEIYDDHIRCSLVVAGKQEIICNIGIELLAAYIIETNKYSDELESCFPYFIVGIDHSKSDEISLMITLSHMNGQQIIEQKLSATEVIDWSEVELGNFSDILYIGQSHRIKKRILTHEKTQQALAEVRDENDIYIYFFSFAIERLLLNPLEHANKINEELLSIIKSPTFGDRKEINIKAKVNLVEMALINHFKPKYNNHYVNSGLSSNKQIKEMLAQNNYTKLVLSVSFDNDCSLWRFGSESVVPNCHHLIEFNL
jgi:hypothetical protein